MVAADDDQEVAPRYMKEIMSLLNDGGIEQPSAV